MSLLPSRASAKKTVWIALLALGSSVALGQPTFPVKPVRIIVPYPPGGTNNLLARHIGQKLGETWGQQILVDNRPGGNTVIGTELLARAAPDGYTIMAMSGTHVINALLHPALPFDALKDFTAVGTISRQEYLLVSHPALPVKSLQQLLALAKARPGQLNFATSGNGSVSHLATEMLSMLSGTKMQSIPYKGSGPALLDLLGGQVHLLFQPPVAVIGHINAGKLRGIAISGGARTAVLPKVPTFAESGLPGFSAKNWNGVLAPAGLPRNVLARLATDLATAIQASATKEWLQSQGMEPLVSSPEQFTALMTSELAVYGKIVRAANIKMGG